MGPFSRISRRSQAIDRAPKTSDQGRMEKIAGESVDALFDGRLLVAQSCAGYRFSIDALLLAHFVTVRAGDRIVDLGSGSGVVGLALAALNSTVNVTGLELQAAMAERARRSARWNRMESRVRMLHADIRRSPQLPEAGSFDIAVCNPPYRLPGSGRISAGDERRIARHELNGGLADFLGAAARLVRNKGRAGVVHLAARAVDVLAMMREVGIEPKRLRMVHSHAGAEASLLLVEGVKGGKAGLAVHRPLILYRSGKNYSAEAAALIAGRREKLRSQRFGRRRE